MTVKSPDVICVCNGWGGYVASLIYSDIPIVFIDFGVTPEQAARQIRAAAPRKNISSVLLHFDIALWDGVIDRLPELVKLLAREGIYVWNGEVRDIRKRRIHDTCNRLGLPHLGSLAGMSQNDLTIIKTDLNALGRPELKLRDDQLECLGLGDLRRSKVPSISQYSVQPLCEVPPEVWLAPELVVEKYVSRSDGLFFRTYFARERCVFTQAQSPELIKRFNRPFFGHIDYFLKRPISALQLLANLSGPTQIEAFEQVVRFADAFGLDYGAVDQVVDENGRSFVIDVNPTPCWGTGDIQALREHLRA